MQGHSSSSCVNNVIDPIQPFDSMCLVIHPEKSVTIPKHQITILGFTINSRTMIIRLTEEK